MSEASPQAALPVEGASAQPEMTEAQNQNTKGTGDTNGVDAKADVVNQLANDATGDADKTQDPKDDQASVREVTESASTPIGEDVVMKDTDEPTKDTDVVSKKSNNAQGDAQPSASKSKSRRKSAVPEHKVKKKASKAKMTHTDARPGEYFYLKLKGYPAWPVIVCDEGMLPEVLLKSRPVTAARPDGSYRSDFADGGAKEKERTFPVMFLQTNEFAWAVNTELIELVLDTVGKAPSKAGKSLQMAHQIASENHDLQHFKDLLKEFSEAKKAEMEAKQADQEAKEAKEAKKATKAKRKSNVMAGEDDDTEMLDVDDAEDGGTPAASSAKPKTKKRKAEDDTKTDSVKKPRTTIKLTNKSSTPKTANGTATPKSTKEPKAEKSVKSKKQTPKAKEEEGADDTPLPQQELSPDEKRVRKQKEVLYVRHKLQKGLLDKATDPKAEEMPSMSEWMAKLENFTNLEVSIIRATKINKVLKNIVKMPASKIPMEDEFRFQQRSTALLDEWNTIPNIDDAGEDSMVANSNDKATKAGASPIEATNGVKDSSADVNAKKTAGAKEDANEETKVDDEKIPAANVEEASKESNAVEAAA